MTLNQVVDSIADAMDKSLDIAFKERLKFVVKYWRARLIKQELDKGSDVNIFLQSFIVSLETVDVATSCLVDTGCLILRSTLPIPRLIRDRSGKFLGTVMSATGKTVFEQCNIENVPLKLATKYRKNTIFFDIVNRYCEIYHNRKLEFARFKVPVDDLDTLKAFQCELTTNSVCYTDDTDFPFPSDLIPFIINGLLNNELKLPNRNDMEVDINTDNNDRD